jgi:hypothetical protein
MCCPVSRDLYDGLITRLRQSKNRLRNLRFEAAKVLTRTVEPLMMKMKVVSLSCSFFLQNELYINLGT